MQCRADIDRKLFGRLFAIERKRWLQRTTDEQPDVYNACYEASELLVLLGEYKTIIEKFDPVAESSSKRKIRNQCIDLAAECLLLAYDLEDAS